MANGSITHVAGATAEEFLHVKKCLPDWECVNTPLNDRETALSSNPETSNLIILYARKKDEKTHSICEEIRKTQEGPRIPILLVISRYQIPQGNDVKRMGNVAFIFSPFNEKELEEKISGLLEGS